MTVLNRLALLFTVAFIFVSALGACDITNNQEKKANTAKKTHEDTLVTVNGVPIGYQDVDNLMKKNSKIRKATPQMKKSVLEMVILHELMSQKAVELGLDKQSDDQKQIQRFEAQLNALKRKILSKRFRTEEIINKAVINEDEMKAYFAENLPGIQTEFHVKQILYRGDEKAINDDLNEIKSGASFEAIAARRFPKLPEKMERYPWDLGYLRWNQIPEEWQDVIYGMEKGETSGILKGPGNRFSIIALVEKRENPDADFESLKAEIERILKNKKIVTLSNQWEKKLRDAAEVIYYGKTEKENELPK